MLLFNLFSIYFISGPNAPLASNLISWLKNHPTYEIVRPGQLPTSKFYSQPKNTTAKPAPPHHQHHQTNPKPQQKSQAAHLKQTVLAAKPGSKHIILSTKVPFVKQSPTTPVQPKPQVLGLLKQNIYVCLY